MKMSVPAPEAEWPGRQGNADLGCGDWLRASRFLFVSKFPSPRSSTKAVGRFFEEKPLARIPAQMSPRRLGPMPKQFSVRGDPSAPSSRLLYRLRGALGKL